MINKVNQERREKGVINLTEEGLDEEYLKELARGFESYMEYLTSSENLTKIEKNNELYKRINNLSKSDVEKVLKFIEMLED